MALIDAANLRFSYRPGEWVLKNVSLQIEQGEMVAITGESGSGKSTLFYLLGALTDRYEGKIQIAGATLSELSPAERAQFRNQEIGFVFQQFFLLPRATARENILLPTYYPSPDSRPTAQDVARVEELAMRLGLRDLLERGPQEMSGGQQQRVAIARALMRDPGIILADEPTGNLDSQTTQVVLDIFKELNRQGRTVILITHSPEVAAQCTRVIRLKDGQIASDAKAKEPVSENRQLKDVEQFLPQKQSGDFLKAYIKTLGPALDNIFRAKAKAALTMLGVILGIAAVLSTMSLGRFAKTRIMSSYESVGVNNLGVSGWSNWRRSTRDYSPAVFQSFSWEKDVEPMLAIFPAIEMASPQLMASGSTFNLNGLSLADDRSTFAGVGEDFFKITNQTMDEGRNFSALDIERANPVCIVGQKINGELGGGDTVLGKILTVANDNLGVDFPCKIVGILNSEPTESGVIVTDFAVFVPYTYYQKVSIRPWNKEIRDLKLKITMGIDPDSVGEQIRGYFASRYGTSGIFDANSNAKTVAQMKLFLNVFSLLLTAVAVIALIVGGIGINNMMLVNLSERLNEIGLRKSLGASGHLVRALVLTESLVLSILGGAIGLSSGFLIYHLLIYLGSHIIPNTKFEWIIDPWAVLIASLAMIITGVLSGLVPALKADRMQVIDALRRE